MLWWVSLLQFVSLIRILWKWHRKFSALFVGGVISSTYLIDLDPCNFRMQTHSVVSAANSLAQAAEAKLPKQKKSLAAAEFKHAKIAQKRQSKMQQEGRGEFSPWIKTLEKFPLL